MERSSINMYINLDIPIWCFVIILIVLRIFWGYVTRTMIHNKGYYEEWFWWGFIFGWMAFVVAITRIDHSRTSAGESPNIINSDKTTDKL